MTHRIRGIILLTAVLLAATPAVVVGQEDDAAAPGETIAPSETAAPSETIAPGSSARVVCAEGACRVTHEALPDDPSIGDGVADPALVPGDGQPARLVCREGHGDCAFVAPATSIEDLLESADGRLVYGVVDTDPSGTWRAIDLPARVRCTIAGAGRSSARVKRSRARASIERQPDGSFVGQSRRAGEEPFTLVRLGPGLYGSIQPFSDGKVSGEVVSYYGLLSEDRIAGTSLMTSTLSDGGPRTRCTMKRNFDMTRISGPSGAEETVVPAGEGEADGTDPAAVDE